MGNAGLLQRCSCVPGQDGQQDWRPDEQVIQERLRFPGLQHDQDIQERLYVQHEQAVQAWPRSPGQEIHNFDWKKALKTEDGPPANAWGGGWSLEPSSSAQASAVAGLSAVVADVVEVATGHMGQHDIISAEKSLVQSLSTLGTADVALIRQQPIYASVADRAARYDELGIAMEHLARKKHDGFELVWEEPGARVWLQAPPDQTWFKARVALDIEAPLHHCLCATNELDLQPLWQTLLAEEPVAIGLRSLRHQIVRSLQSVLVIRAEILTEVHRVMNKDFGALVEFISSDFPREGLELPERGWLTTSVDVDTTNIWIPRGGGQEGTTLLLLSKIEMGMRPPDAIVNFLVDRAARDIAAKFRSSAALLQQPGENPWRERLRRDQFGLYADLKELEAAAARRKVVDAFNLPGWEVVAREHRLGEFRPPPKGATQEPSAEGAVVEDGGVLTGWAGWYL